LPQTRASIDNFVRNKSPIDQQHLAQTQKLNMKKLEQHLPDQPEIEKSEKTGKKETKQSLITIASLAEENALLLQYL